MLQNEFRTNQNLKGLKPFHSTCSQSFNFKKFLITVFTSSYMITLHSRNLITGYDHIITVCISAKCQDIIMLIYYQPINSDSSCTNQEMLKWHTWIYCFMLIDINGFSTRTYQNVYCEKDFKHCYQSSRQNRQKFYLCEAKKWINVWWINITDWKMTKSVRSTLTHTPDTEE